MSSTVSAISSPTHLCPSSPLLRLSSYTSFSPQIHRRSLPSSSSATIQPLKLQFPNIVFGFSAKNYVLFSNGRVAFCASAANDEGEGMSSVDEFEEARRQSTMPERFRYLTKEAPDPPVRWPWFVALVFLLYAWRTVLWELSNWRKTVIGIFHFVGYLLELALAFIFHFIGNPITTLIRCVETAFYTIRSFYSSIVAYAPVPELTVIILLASTVLAIAEAAAPESVNSQPYLLTVAGLIGFAAVRGFISEPFFWMLLLGMFGFARFVKKRDYVSSTLPVAAVLAAVGEPWVRIVTIILYTSLAVSHHSKKVLEGNEEDVVLASARRLPTPLLGVALAIGIHVAAKWAGYRHLTWMVV